MNINGILIYVVAIIFLCTSTRIVTLIIKNIKQRKIKQQIDSLSNNALEITPEEFMEMRKHSSAGIDKSLYYGTMNFPGVYILHNKTKGLYYVGQGQKILDRVNNHFTGKGNGNVYADYKYGDTFTIRMIKLAGSGFETLNALERNTIMVYDAYNNGYNKTRGNKG